MKTAEGQLGRVFLIRLEDGDVIPGSIERFAADNGVSVGFALFVGSADKGKLVAGSENPSARPLNPLLASIEGLHEGSAVGVLAPAEDGKPVLAMHGSFGRAEKSMTGGFRAGVSTWMTGEVVLYEVLGTHARRVFDKDQGLAFLVPDARPASAPVATRAITEPEPEPVAAAKGPHTAVLYLHNAQWN